MKQSAYLYGYSIGWLLLLAATLSDCQSSVSEGTSSSNGSNNTSAVNANEQIQDPTVDNNSLLSIGANFINGTGSLVSSSNVYQMNVLTSIFDAYNWVSGSDANADMLFLILSSDANLYQNYNNTSQQVTLTANTQILLIQLQNFDDNFNNLDLTTGDYSADPNNDGIGLNATVSYYSLDSACNQLLSDALSSSISGNVLVETINLQSNAASVNGNFLMGMGDMNEVIYGNYHATAAPNFGQALNNALVADSFTCVP